MMISLAPLVKVELDGESDEIKKLQKTWVDMPFVIQTSYTEASKVMALLKSPDLSKPTLKAGLSQDLVRDWRTLQLIDNSFITAIEDYKRSLINATASDLVVSLQPRNTMFDFQIALAYGAAKLVQNTPNIPVIKHIIGPILSCIGAFYGMITQESITREQNKLNHSEHRKKWLETVITKEEIRIKNAIKCIEGRVKIIQRDIEEKDNDLIDTKLIDELKGLDIFITHLTPEAPLKLNDQLVADYISQIRITAS